MSMSKCCAMIMVVIVLSFPVLLVKFNKVKVIFIQIKGQAKRKLLLKSIYPKVDLLVLDATKQHFEFMAMSSRSTKSPHHIIVGLASFLLLTRYRTPSGGLLTFRKMSTLHIPTKTCHINVDCRRKVIESFRNFTRRWYTLHDSKKSSQLITETC